MRTHKLRISAKAVHYCLKNLDNPMALKRSPLTQLSQTQALAKRYPDLPWATGLALRDLIREGCNRALAIEVPDKHSQTIQAFLRIYLETPNVAHAARTLGMDRRRIYEWVLPQAMELVASTLDGQTS